MVQASTILDDAQKILNDSAAIWTRTELLHWLEDGYRLILSRTHAAKTFTALASPPRHTYTITYDWEQRYVQNGSYRKWTFTNRTEHLETPFYWEEAILDGQSPQNSETNLTQLWELAYSTERVEAHFRLFFPHNHDQLHALWWDHKRLEPTSIRELDQFDDSWWQLQGQPYFFSDGLGPDNTVEVFEIVTNYIQAYDLPGSIEGGTARGASGSRTYSIDSSVEWDYAYAIDMEATYQDTLTGLGYRFTQNAVTGTLGTGLHGVQIWEKELLEGVDSADFTTGSSIGTYPWEADFSATVASIPIGTLRRATSSLRQYFPESQWFTLGILRAIESSTDQFLIWHSIIPERGAVTESSELDMLHDQILRKYLKYFVLSRAFGRQGEGFDAYFATHYEQRFMRVFQVMQRLDFAGHRDVQYGRVPKSDRPRGVARPRLPSNFPRLRYY